MMLANATKIALVALFLHWGASVAQADFIDSFDAPLSQNVLTTDPGSFNNTTSPGSGILGNSREESGQYTSDGSSSVNIVIAGGEMKIELGKDAKATVSLTYDGNGSGLGNLSSYDQIVLTDLDFDFSGPQMTVTVTVDGQSQSQIVADGTYNNGADMIFDFAGHDWINVGSIQVEFELPMDGDLSLTGIMLGPATVVPEPAAMAVWLMVGIVGLMVGLRMHRQKSERRAA